MNRTLIQILTENIQHHIPEKYATLDDLSTWSKANREDRMADVRELKNLLAKEAHDYLAFISTTQLNGKSLLAHKIDQEIEASIAQFLGICREQMDATTDLKALDKNFPFDYEWLQQEIRSSLKTISETEDELLVKENERLSKINEQESL